MYHVFSAKTYHLTPHLIESTIEKIPNDHFFIIMGPENVPVNWKLYSSLFQKLNFKKFLFATSLSELRQIADLDKKSLIILHGDSYIRMLYFYKKKYKNVHWVCWGSGTKINKSLKSYFSAILKKKIYKFFKSIITLNEVDHIELQRNFKLSKIHTIPYLGSLHNMQNFKKENLQSTKSNNLVYIGNNSSCLPSYPEMIRKLAQFSPAVGVQCMLNYDLVEDEFYTNLKNEAVLLFGDKFRMNTEFYELQDYPDYMNKCDIYICNVDRQSGLAAIYITLVLGKKLFLRGNNYNFIKSLGCIIYNVDEIEKMSSEDFLSPLALSSKEINFDIIMEYLDDNNIIRKWNNFFAIYLN